MKKILFLFALIGLISCNNQDPQSIKTKISNKKAEIVKLEKDIEDLQLELVTLEGNNHTTFNVIKVKAKQIAPEPFNHYFEASGMLEAVNSAVISPEIVGKIEDIYIKEGEYVTAGTLLAKINTAVIESSIKELETGLTLASLIYEKQKNLWEQNIGSEIQFLEAKNRKESLEQSLITAKSQLDLSVLRAPINGIVEDVRLKKGELASPGYQVMQIVNLDEMYVNVNVPDKFIAAVHQGDTVNVRFPSYNNLEFNEEIYRTGNIINNQSLTFEVQLKIENENGSLKPNVLSVVKFNDYSNDKAITLPAIIIKQDLKGSYVYVARKSGERMIANKQYIKTGFSYNDLTMITEGLAINDLVITDGYNLVSDGLKVDVVD
ncbi:MAG: efflux RND transporter periplasmic adaptor subunit [Bacteroidales bacterium]|nr:efflux RND transporter periplasmic adaptor subunit [Bacteroidales bacterium]